VCEKKKGSRKIHAVLGVSHTLQFRMPGTKESIKSLFPFTENKRKGTDKQNCKFQMQLRITTTTHASQPHE
jgi:hypothetical protein